jgi:hypothetical protein
MTQQRLNLGWDLGRGKFAQCDLFHPSGNRTASAAVLFHDSGQGASSDWEPPDIDLSMGPLNRPEYFMNYLKTTSNDPLGSFVTSQRLRDVPFLFPMLAVEGVGSVPMPLTESASEQLKTVARKAPFGVGSETHFNDDVRNCWEIDSSKMSVMQSSESQEYFAKVVQDCC